jgi:NADH-quinone oxidoreductase subunit M
MLGLYFVNGRATGVYTFDYFQLQHANLSLEVSILLALGFIAAFAVKLPMIVLHTWLPDAHTEAPTAGSVILAGLLLKTGAFGFIRFVLPIFPAAAVHLAPAAMALGIAGIIYGAAMAFAQTDLKRLVAYSSVSHLGFVLVGIFAFNEPALQGATIQMIAHGISTGALFMVVGMLQERIHTRDMDRMGGLWSTVPTMGAVALVFGLASLGLPGTINFDGEFLILIGAYKISPMVAAFSAAGLVFSAVYSLYAIYRVFFGEKRMDWTIPDLSFREFGALAAMIVAIFGLGFYPKPILKTSAPAVKAVETKMAPALAGANHSFSWVAEMKPPAGGGIAKTSQNVIARSEVPRPAHRR